MTKKWYFEVQLFGEADTTEEAWKKAVEGFKEDPGEMPEPGDVSMDEIEDECARDVGKDLRSGGIDYSREEQP